MATAWCISTVYSVVVIFTLLLADSRTLAVPPCPLTGSYFYQAQSSTIITFAPTSPDNSTYRATCTPLADCGWATASVTVDIARPWSSAFNIVFAETTGSPLPAAAWALGMCSDQRVIYFGGTSQWSAPWCGLDNPNCTVPLDPVWTVPDAAIHLIEVSHSDIGWLGLQDDMLVNAANINLSLALMDANPDFVWQHECILFIRTYVEMYPEREAELIARIAEGRFDIGGTFTEGFESTMLNEILARQMYTGRKFVLPLALPSCCGLLSVPLISAPVVLLHMPQVVCRTVPSPGQCCSRLSSGWPPSCPPDSPSPIITLRECVRVLWLVCVCVCLFSRGVRDALLIGNLDDATCV